MKTIEDIVQELDHYNINPTKIYKGILGKDTWYAWRKRGLPKQVQKYFEILQRLEELKNPKPIAKGWGASNQHDI